MRLVIISGRSGSGKTTALRALEDAGYNCIDNFPVNLLQSLVHDALRDPAQRNTNVAVCIDARSRDLERFPELLLALEFLRDHPVGVLMCLPVEQLVAMVAMMTTTSSIIASSPSVVHSSTVFSRLFFVLPRQMSCHEKWLNCRLQTTFSTCRLLRFCYVLRKTAKKRLTDYHRFVVIFL